jgi:hypothetical protein
MEITENARMALRAVFDQMLPRDAPRSWLLRDLHASLLLRGEKLACLIANAARSQTDDVENARLRPTNRATITRRNTCVPLIRASHSGRLLAMRDPRRRMVDARDCWDGLADGTMTIAQTTRFEPSFGASANPFQRSLTAD